MQKKQIKIVPSILSGDFGNLAASAQRAEKSGADALHIDIMDGHFVPNLTLGPQAVLAIRQATQLFLDVHLMIYNPFDFIERFVQAGANRITFHLEATEDVADTLRFIRRCNIQAGLALCPDTSVELLPKYLDQCDVVLIMTVNPGFGGQEFMPDVLEKIEFIAKACETRKLPTEIQVDGGINLKTAKSCVQSGANILVSGSFLYQAQDMKQTIGALRGVGK